MKLDIYIDKEREEQVIVYAHERNELTRQIEQLVFERTEDIIGYKEREALRLGLSEIYCFTVTDNRVYAMTEKESYQLRCRLYQLEERLPETFVKINQSCIVNIKMIGRFNASVSGTLNVILKNGYTDYISRRNLKKVKERLGL